MDENNNLGNQNPNTNINPYDLNNQPQEANNLQDSQGQVSNNINENSVQTDPYTQSTEDNPYYNPYFQNNNMENSPYNNDIYNQNYMGTEPNDSVNLFNLSDNNNPSDLNSANNSEPNTNINTEPSITNNINQNANPNISSNIGQDINTNYAEPTQENTVTPVNPILNPNLGQPDISNPQYSNNTQDFNQGLNNFDTTLNLNNNPQENNINQSAQNAYGNNNDEEFKKSWMGKLYDKANKRKFNIPAFFFGGLYYLYRKLYLFGFIFIILSCLISILGIYTTITSIGNSSSIVLPILLTLLLPLILAVVYGFAFYPLYKKDVNNKLKKYKNEAQTPAQLLDTSKQKGGTSIPFVLLGILLSGIISSIALTTVMASALAGFMENVLGGFKTPQNQLNTNTSVNENDIYAPTYDTFNFYNDYYFEYDSSTWAETEDGSLAYGNYTLSYIQSIENLTSAGFDINQNDGRSSFFTYLYNLFSSQIDAQSTTLELGSSSFIYDNGIYYSYFDLVYSASIERCYFVLIPEDDIFMEFILSNTDTVIPDDIHNEIVSYIGSITDEDVITDTNAVQNSNIVNEAGNENTIPASGTLDTAQNSEASNEIDVNNIEPQSSSSNVVEVGNTTPSSNGGLTITTPTNVPGIVTAHNTIQ